MGADIMKRYLTSDRQAKKLDLHEPKGIAPRQTERRRDDVDRHDLFWQPAFEQPSFIRLERFRHVGNDFTKDQAQPHRRADHGADILDIEGQMADTMAAEIDDERVALFL
ncbi:hypothetical protein U5A89_07950 [Sphingobium sp. HWE2-09]|uniref:hypothetical protein n=1 Tax=Sphingobium sp. HWE2-09 TaxID=3108390 RepID=UPI002DC9FCBE|nr:hypothetical protein [Sphingobium sp. HWE2-09]